jgi:hypothetical protein
LQEGLRRVYRRRPPENGERRIALANHPSAPTVHVVGRAPTEDRVHVKHSVQDTDELPFGLLACIVGILVVQWLLRWLNW